MKRNIKRERDTKRTTRDVAQVASAVTLAKKIMALGSGTNIVWVLV